MPPGCFRLRSPAGSVEDDASKATAEDTGNGEGDDPTTVDPADHAPVDRAPGTGAETDTNDGTSDALGGGDGKLCQGELVSCPKVHSG